MTRSNLFIFFLLISSTLLGQQSLFEAAEELYRQGSYQQAYQKYREAGEAVRVSDASEYATCQLHMAKCQLELGDLESCIALVDQTLKNLTVEEKNENLQTQLLLVKGEAYLKSGRNDVALQTLLETEAQLKTTEDLTAASCYNDLGVVYWNNGNRETALAYLERALKTREKMLPANDVLLADSYLNIGLIYLEDEYLQAILYFNRAQDIYSAQFGASHPKVAYCYSNLAFANSRQGNHLAAIEYLDKNMAIWEAAFTGDHPNKAFTLSNKGRIFETQRNYVEALRLQEQALAQYQRLYGDRHPEVANTHFLIGSVHQKAGQLQLAVESFQRAIYANLFDQNYTSVYDLPDIRDYYHADILLFALQSKAQALEALHFEKTLRPADLKSALAAYAKCDELISTIRQFRLSEGDKLKLGAAAADVYNNGIRLALLLSTKTLNKKTYLEQAFRFCERSKAAVLQEAIQETQAKHFAGIPDALIELEDSLKREISWLEQQLAQSATEETTNRLKALLFDYQSANRQFVAKLEMEYPQYFQLKYNQQFTTPEEIISALPPRTAMLSYFIGHESIFVFYLSKGRFKGHELIKPDNLLKQVGGLRNAMKYRIREAYEKIAFELYEALIPPIENQVDHLIILPDGVLGTVPFEALLTRSPGDSPSAYLIHDYAVSYDFSASLVVGKLTEPPRESKGILLAAPVTFDQNELRMPRLPGSEQEVTAIHELFRSSVHRPMSLIGGRASESALYQADLSAFSFLHLATHGVVNESNPSLSRIFLQPDGSADGSLYSGEIYTMELAAQLVTLSACETGLGKIEKGEGIVGLSRSLTYAGAKNLIVSLWQVADASTAELMVSFYQHLLSGTASGSFHEHLRAAKLQMIEREAYAAPYYWAPFILIGQ